MSSLDTNSLAKGDEFMLLFKKTQTFSGGKRGKTKKSNLQTCIQSTSYLLGSMWIRFCRDCLFGFLGFLNLYYLYFNTLIAGYENMQLYIWDFMQILNINKYFFFYCWEYIILIKTDRDREALHSPINCNFMSKRFRGAAEPFKHLTSSSLNGIQTSVLECSYMIHCLVFRQYSQFKIFPCISSLTPAIPHFLYAAPWNKK